MANLADILLTLSGRDAGASAAVAQLQASILGLTAAIEASTAASAAQAAAEQAATAAAVEETAAVKTETVALSGAAKAAGALREEFVGGVKDMAAAFIGFEALRGGIERVIEASRDETQAQLQLNAMFGASAEEYARFSEQVSQGTNFTTVQFERASVVLSELQRDYGLTDAQMQQLLHTTADLAAASGTGLVQAAQDVRGTIQGMSRAGAELGINVRGPVIQSMTELDEQTKKNVTSADANTAALARLNVINAEAAQRMGAAGIAASEEGDKFAQLDKATSHLYETLGASPAVGGVIGDLGKAVTAVDQLIQVFNLLGSGSVDAGHAVQGLSGLFSEMGAAAMRVPGPVSAAGAAFESLGAEVQTAGQGISLLEQQLGLLSPAIDDAATAHGRLTMAEREGREASVERITITDEEKKSLDELGQSLAQVAQAEGDLAGRHPTLDIGQAMSVNWGITAESIKAAQQQLAAYGLELARANAQGDAFSRHIPDKPTTEADIQKAAADQAQAAKQQEEAQKRAADQAEQLAKEHWARMNALEDRGTQDVRQTYDRALEDERRAEDRNFQISETSWQDYYKNLDDQAKASAESEISAREAVRDAALKAIEDQIQAARDEAEAQKRGIQDAETAQREALQAQKEAARQAHDAAIQGINAERDALLEQLSVQEHLLDAQLRALDASEQTRKSHEDLQQAEQTLAQARATGTGIGAAQQALTDLQAKQAADQRRQALEDQKRQLQETQQVTRDEADARRQALDQQQGEIQRQFADFNSFNAPGAAAGINSDTAGALSPTQQAVSPFELQKRAVDDALQTRLRALEAEKQGVTDTAQRDIDGLKARETATDRFYQGAEQASQKYFTGEHTRLEDARRDWDRYVTDARTSFDQGLADMRYAMEHPGAGGAGSFAAAFGGTATPGAPGARSPFASVGAAAAGGSVTIQQTNYITAGGQEDTVAVVVRASRDGMTQALLAAGLTS